MMANPAEATLWVADGERVRPVKVRTGLSDGTHTEVTANELQEGAQVVIGEEFAADGNEASDPFSPKVFGGGSRRPQQ